MVWPSFVRLWGWMHTQVFPHDTNSGQEILPMRELWSGMVRASKVWVQRSLAGGYILCWTNIWKEIFCLSQCRQRFRCMSNHLQNPLWFAQNYYQNWITLLFLQGNPRMGGFTRWIDNVTPSYHGQKITESETQVEYQRLKDHENAMHSDRPRRGR